MWDSCNWKLEVNYVSQGHTIFRCRARIQTEATVLPEPTPAPKQYIGAGVEMHLLREVCGLYISFMQVRTVAC